MCVCIKNIIGMNTIVQSGLWDTGIATFCVIHMPKRLFCLLTLVMVSVRMLQTRTLGTSFSGRPAAKGIPIKRININSPRRGANNASSLVGYSYTQIQKVAVGEGLHSRNKIHKDFVC